MLRNYSLFIILMFCSVGCAAKQNYPMLEQAQLDNPYQLVWQDEFNCNKRLNKADWTYQKGFKRNEELQWYQADNAYCENGLLVIEGKQVDLPNPKYKPGHKNWRKNRPRIKYTSAAVTTKGKHAWTYGRFEVKAKIKTEAGLWPAIWFLGTEGKWPSNGEIDLMEFYRGKILANAAWGSIKPIKTKWDSAKYPMSHFNDPNWDEKFHIWRMDWNKDYIRLYLDGELLNTIDLSKAINPEGSYPLEPFQHPKYLLLNLAIGGKAGGPVGKNTQFPSRYEIDYVRVYQQTPATAEEVEYK